VPRRSRTTTSPAQNDQWVDTFAATLPFALDPFQRHALEALEGGESVLVTAPTGAGKTIVADYAAFRAIASGYKLAYTTPIKALSNQKYRQLAARYGPDQVGIVTGDTVINRPAPLLVMTTEILRNLLVVSRDPLADIGYVVVDEVHFLSDEQRGVVWEEMLIWCPRHVRLICLSATISNAREVAEWLRMVHGPTRLVRHDERPVPLEDYLFYEGGLHRIRDAHGRRTRYFPHVGVPEGERIARRLHERLGRERPEAPDVPAAPAVVAALRARSWLPVIYFRFGRRAAEEMAWSIVNSGTLSPLDEERSRGIEDAMARTLLDMDDDTRGLQQVTDVVRILPSGIAYHHAGLIHPLKALVEELFAAGHLDAVVATSTLAMGLHLPARSVVIGELKKFNGRSFEPLTATEYRQMTGRAGRRGIDTMGVAVLVPSTYLPLEPAFRAMSGEPEPLRSAFALRYNTLLNTYSPDDEERILILLENNLGEFHRRREQESRGRPRERRRGQRALLYAMLEVLTAERLMGRDGRLKTRGRVARHIFNPWEIAVTHVLLDGSLSLLEPPEVAEVMSLFIPSKLSVAAPPPDRRRRRRPQRPLTPREELLETIDDVVTRLRGREARHGLELTPEWQAPDHSFVRAWCSHGQLSETVEEFDLPAGDALQLLGQTLDLLEQGVHALTDVFGPDDEHVALQRAAIAAISQRGKLERLLGL
jgi:superfamily II RNA helicase